MNIVHQFCRCALARPDRAHSIRGRAIPSLVPSRSPLFFTTIRPHSRALTRNFAGIAATMNASEGKVPPGVAHTVWKQDEQASITAHMHIHLLTRLAARDSRVHTSAHKDVDDKEVLL